MKKILLSLLFSTLAFSTPAYADHGYYEDDCQGGGCGTEREEQYGDNSCKYVCPDFKDSPVHDAFNFSPVVCLPGSTCNFDDKKQDESQR